MDITFAIVRAENADYLCHHANGIYVDVSNGRSTGSEDRTAILYLVFMPTGGWLFCCRAWRMKVSISSFLSIWRKWMPLDCPTGHLLT